MSAIDYNQVQLQPTTFPPVQQYMNNQYRHRGDVYGGNPNNYQHMNNNNNNNNNNNFYPRNNTFYNQNFQQQRYNGNNNYWNNSRPPQSRQRRFNNSRGTSRSGSKRQQQQQQQQQQQRRSGPTQLRLNDFMPPQLRATSTSNIPNLPLSFNLENSDYTGTTNTRTTNTGTTNTRSNTPLNVPTQQPKNFSTQTITTNDTTQPFDVNDYDNSNISNQHEQQKQERQNTTSSFRRRQRRTRQQQYRNTSVNRFAELAETNAHTDIEPNDDDDNVAQSIIDNTNAGGAGNNKKRIKSNNKKKKQPIYLEPTRVLRYMQDNATSIIGARGNQAYVLAATGIYDQWVRDNYDLQVWQNYLKMGTQDKHWAKEVIKRTKKRDDVINSRFVQKKIHHLTTSVAQANATIANLQIQLATYWTQTITGTTISTAPPSTTNTNRIRESTERLEKTILKYIQHCTQHVKELAENKIQLAKSEMAEFKALENFETTATPLQWNIHSMLKPKLKQWRTKNKNYQIATKRVEYDLPPNFISKINLTFKIDESILNKEEGQELYNDMRQLTKEYRIKSMSLYLKSITREREILSNEIERIIEGFPKGDNDEFDVEAGFIAFKQYHELRDKRFQIEAEQSSYFLVKQRVEGDVKEEEQDKEELVAPTLTRSLGEDFSL